MSGRADIIALAQTLGLQTTDPVLLDRYYTESLFALAEGTDVALEATIIAVTAGVSTYFMPTSGNSAAVRIVAAFFGRRELTRTNLQAIVAVDPEWRTTQGTPRMYMEEHEDDLTVRLYPVPSATSAGAVLAPDPFGADYPLDRLVVLTADTQEIAAPWLDYPLALGMLGRELAHQSSYRDPQLSATVTKLGQLMRGLGGLP